MAYCWRLLVLLLALLVVSAHAEQERRLSVSEGASVGQRIGFVQDGPANASSSSDGTSATFYLVFPDPDSMAEKVLSVNEQTGEILLQGELDHEKESQLVFLAIPTDGSTTTKVVVEVLDENDNAPQFPVPSVNLEISEYARIDTELVLPSAVDPDSEPFSVKKYVIAGGNVNNVFRLATNRLNNVLYVDLVVNGQLDREYRDRYDLVVEAIDGGDPPKKGSLNVHVVVLDANDNAPEFLQSRYSAQLTPNATVGTQVVTVKAKDLDAGENARISYRLASSGFGTSEKIPFRVDAESGLITVVSGPLEPGAVFELAVIASDHGVPQPLESTVFLTVRVQNGADGFVENQLNIVWVTEDGTPRFSEGLTLGYVLARISVQSRKGESLTLNGSDSLCLKQTDSPTVYLVLVCGPLDRELHPELFLNFHLRNAAGESLLDHPVLVELIDVNDNAPSWNRTEFHVSLPRLPEAQIVPFRFLAVDPDAGDNGRISYSVDNTSLFLVDLETGILSVRRELDCATAADELKFTVRATDHGDPPLSSDATVVVTLVDADGSQLVFERTLYEASVREDVESGTCLLQVTAVDKTCGQGPRDTVRYSFKDGLGHAGPFKLDAETGKVCLQKPLDYESTTRYQLTVAAHRRDGQDDPETATTLVNVIVEDVNDNSPVFVPDTYNITVAEDVAVGTALLTVRATDLDVGTFGEVRYQLDATTPLFHVDAQSGRLYVDRPLLAQAGQNLTFAVWARDAGGLRSAVPATVFVHVLMSDQDCPQFARGLYDFTIAEDILPGISIGSVQAVSRRIVSYAIVAGDSEDFFLLHEKTGSLTVERELDADRADTVLLNVRGRASDGCSAFTQVRVRIHDINDNAPTFDLAVAETSVPENLAIHEPFFAVQAVDRDQHENGRITYELVRSEPVCPVIVRPLTGQLLLAASLDFEKTRVFNLTIRAQDQGIPPKAGFMSVVLHVLDVNDNAPEFEQQLYELEIAEDADLMTPLYPMLLATDRDGPGPNSQVRYHFSDDGAVSDFGLNEKTGELYVKRPLDRERTSDYAFVVTASDRASPPLTANATVRVRVLDVNDNTPNCSSITPLRASGDVEPGATLGLLNASDPDLGPNGTVVYRLQQPNAFIKVDPDGRVLVQRKFDSSSFKSPIQLLVIVKDQGPVPRPAVCTLTIELDRTESKVEFVGVIEKTLYVGAKDPERKALTQLRAKNAAAWRVEPTGIGAYFGISANGSVYIAAPGSSFANRLKKPQPLTISAFDNKNRRRTVTFIVRFALDPEAERNETAVVKLRKSAVVGSKLITLSDAIHENEYFCALKKSPFFELDEENGAVFLAANLRNYRHLDSMLNLQLEKHLTRSMRHQQVNVVFELDDETNDHAPRFNQSLYTFVVSEQMQVGATVGRVFADDLDDGENGFVKYRFGQAQDQFAMNVETGEIVLQKPLHYHIHPRHALVVEAEDSSPHKLERKRTQSAVIIEVEDGNDNPPVFLSRSNVTLFWDASVNVSEPVHYFVATDVDTGDFGRLTYRIIAGNEADLLHLDAATGALYLRRRIDSAAHITVRASDVSDTPRFADQSFALLVKHSAVGKWSLFEHKNYQFALASAPVPATVVHSFIPRVEAEKKVVKFGLIPEQEFWQIGRTEGILRTNNRVPDGTYRFIVYATLASANATDYASVVVDVQTETTEGPKLVQESCGNLTVPENRAFVELARIFVSRKPTQPQEGMHFAIESGANSLFRINETSGALACDALDREQKAEHFLIISVSDNHKPKRADVCTMRILVSDENDNTPRFDSSTAKVLEISDRLTAPSFLTRLAASDPDVTSTVTFRMLHDPSGSIDLDPDSGDLIFARDYSFNESEFDLTVAATDGQLVAEQKLRILWRRSTKGFVRGQPQFLQQKYIADIAENEPKGIPVVRVETSNRVFMDAPLSLVIVEGGDGAFEFDSDGTLRTTEELDAEIADNYLLKVQAVANPVHLGYPPAYAVVQVRVRNVNDNAPSLRPIKNLTLPEDTPVGSYLLSVAANDVDANSTIEYGLLDGPGAELLSINSVSGAIYLLRPFDFELLPDVPVSVKASDGLNSVSATFFIHLRNVNDHAPVFTSDFYQFSVTPDAAPMTVIGQVGASDRDFGPAGEFYFQLVDSDVRKQNVSESRLFSLDSKTGRLRAKGRLDADKVYFLPVRVTDRGTPALTAHSTVQIKVVERPALPVSLGLSAHDHLDLIVSEALPVYLPFGRVPSGNGSLPVSFHLQRHGDLFAVSPEGFLFTLRPLDRESTQEYHFEVVVAVEDAPGNQSVPVTVQVADINDNAPVFQPETPVLFRVHEQMQKGAILGRLLATDADEPSHISYSILSGNEHGMIRLNKASGALSFDHWDDEALFDGVSNLFNLTFLATDDGSPPRWSVHTAHLQLDVESWSGTAPLFAISVYHKFVLESTPVSSVLLTAQARTRWDAPLWPKDWRYSISDNDPAFDINAHTGEVLLRERLDFERRTAYSFHVRVQDARHRSAIVPVEVRVVGEDEFAPIFSKPTYVFDIPPEARVGQRIGNVFASDEDAGFDGRVSYAIAEADSFVGVDPDTGVLVLRSPLPHNFSSEQLTVIASSGLHQHSRTSVRLEAAPATEPAHPLFPFSPLNKFAVAVAATLLVLLLLLGLVMLQVACARARARRDPKPTKQVYSVARGNIAVMAPMERGGLSPAFPHPASSFECPKKAFSLVSSDSSGSSGGRRSGHTPLVGTGLIDSFGGRSHPDSGIDPDLISMSSSVTDYLTQMGVTPVRLEQALAPQTPVTNLSHDRIDPELSDLIYAKVDEALFKEPGVRFRPTVDLLNARSLLLDDQPAGRAPSFQPLTQVFSQISQMQNVDTRHL